MIVLITHGDSPIASHHSLQKGSRVAVSLLSTAELCSWCGEDVCWVDPHPNTALQRRSRSVFAARCLICGTIAPSRGKKWWNAPAPLRGLALAMSPPYTLLQHHSALRFSGNMDCTALDAEAQVCDNVLQHSWTVCPRIILKERHLVAFKEQEDIQLSQCSLSQGRLCLTLLEAWRTMMRGNLCIIPSFFF